MSASSCRSGWEALRADPLPWLLDGHRPAVHWRLLVELVGRPVDAPAVRRARGAANAAEPVATLLADLHPDGTWLTATPAWRAGAGPCWRLIAAVQLGADPADPRLQAAAGRALEELPPGSGGLTTSSPSAGARLVQALVALGWARDPRVEEALAWFEETAEGWRQRPEVTATALLGALASCTAVRREGLRRRAVCELRKVLAEPRDGRLRLGHPNLGRTDIAETCWALAIAGVGFEPWMRPALRRLQELQDGRARWRRTSPTAATLPMPDGCGGGGARRSRWITLHATVAMQRFAVPAGLPRLFPARPGGPATNPSPE